MDGLLIKLLFNYLLAHAEEGIAAGVEEDSAVVDADEGALDRDHNGAVGVGDEEAPLPEAELLLHVQLHHVGRAEMRRHHRQPADKASAGLRRRRRWEQRRCRHRDLTGRFKAGSALAWSPSRSRSRRTCKDQRAFCDSDRCGVFSYIRFPNIGLCIGGSPPSELIHSFNFFVIHTSI